MPGIQDDREFIPPPPSVGIISQPFETPVSKDVLAAFRSGYITVDDLKRRAIERSAQQDSLKTQLSEGDLRRREVRELGPGEIELKKRQQGAAGTELDIAGITAPARVAIAKDKTQDALDALDPNKRPDLTARKTREALEEAYTQQFLELPSSVELEKQTKPLSFEQWFHDVKLPVALERAQTNRGQASADLQAGDDETWDEAVKREVAATGKESRAEFEEYRKQAALQKNTAARGTLEYYQILSKRLNKAIDEGKAKGAYYEALPKILATQVEDATKVPDKLRTETSSERVHYLQQPDIQNLRKVQTAVYKLLESVAGNPSPKDDIASIFEFMKILDPTSTVREGEYATVENSRSWPAQMRAYWNKATDGIKLQPFERNDLKVAAYKAARGQLRGSVPTITQYLDVEKRIGAPEGSVVPLADREAYEALKETPIGASIPGQPSATKVNDADIGKTVTLNGVTGVLTKNPDGTFSLQ